MKKAIINILQNLSAIQKKRLSLFLFIGTAVLSSCEKNVTLDLPDAKDQIVVEGYIYQDNFPYLLLTRNAPFFGEIDSSQLQQFIIKDAKVTISDGTITSIMQPVPVGQATIYLTSAMRGTPGKTYSLHVEANGMSVDAQTYLPPPVKLDSTWWKADGKKDSLGFVWAHLTDPDTSGNCYRWFAKRTNVYPGTTDQKDDDFIAPIGSTFDDKFINGKSFDFAYNRGELPNSKKEDDDGEERGYFKKGDTVVVKFCTIDRAVLEFWRNEEMQVSNNGNPFSNPAPVKSNIKGGLGVWGAYGVTYDTVIAK